MTGRSVTYQVIGRSENGIDSNVDRLGVPDPSRQPLTREGEETALPPLNLPLISPLVSSLLGASLPLLSEVDGFLYTTVEEPCQQQPAVLTKLNNWTKHMKQTKRPAHWDYTKRTSQEQARTGRIEREVKVEKLSRDLGALEAMQSSRPAKPPGRR